ncbi:MAG: hypothetical protein IKC69_01290 [Clostridia bacterium]|nr:hypothetical protein [Clostridia bacterium]
MKQALALLLSILTLLSAASCSDSQTRTATSEAEAKTEETVPAVTEEEKSEEKTVYDPVADTLTPERLAAIPIANSSMTTEELRQICIDFVKLSVTFQWVPNMTFRYEAKQNGGTPVTFKEGKLYGGIPYVNTASGNIYRIMEYYDCETGVLDTRFLEKNNLLFGTACSGTTGWGWNRVINSCAPSWTYALNASHGLIPVGPYEYDPTIVYFGEGGALDCTDIAAMNGVQVMYESYAASHKADCMVSNGHVRMNGAEPVVVYKEDGTIDGKKSYIVQVEQGLFTTGSYHDRVSADGIPYEIQGNEGLNPDGSPYYYTFEQLYKKGYLPHTFKEFLGLDPVEEAEITVFEYEGETFTAKAGELKDKRIEANYVISHTVTTVCDAQGNQKIRYIYRCHPHYTRKAMLEDCIPLKGIEQYQKAGGHTIKIEAQLGNGSRLVVYEGMLASE